MMMRPTAAKDSSFLMDTYGRGNPPERIPKWRKVASGGMQPGYDDDYTDDSFLEDMVMNANVVKRDMAKVMLDSVAISQYLSIVAFVGVVWTYALQSSLDKKTIPLIDAGLLLSGFLILLLTEKMISFCLLIHYLLNVSFFATGLYMLAPVYKTLTRSISSDSICYLGRSCRAADRPSVFTRLLSMHHETSRNMEKPGTNKLHLIECLHRGVCLRGFLSSFVGRRVRDDAVLLPCFSVCFPWSPIASRCTPLACTSCSRLC